MMNALHPVTAPSVQPVGSVPEGKVADFLTGKFVKDTPGGVYPAEHREGACATVQVSPRRLHPGVHHQGWIFA